MVEMNIYMAESLYTSAIERRGYIHGCCRRPEARHVATLSMVKQLAIPCYNVRIYNIYNILKIEGNGVLPSVMK